MRRASTLLVVVLVAYVLLPLLWLLRLSLTPEIDIHQWPPRLLPATLTGGHYADVLADGRFWRQIGNSLLVCTLATLVSLACGAWGAYGLARHRFRARDALLAGLLLLHLVPGVANMAAVYRVADAVGALNSLLFVALLKTTGVTVAAWILVAAFRRVPAHLEFAAELDGCSRRQALWRVTLPLVGPALLTAGVLLFVQSWNTFFLPFLLLDDPRKMTLTVGLYRYFTEHGFEPGHAAAFMLLSILPVVALFLVFRRRLWSGFEI